MHTLFSNGQIIYQEDYTCILQPENGKGGIYIGNLQAAQNLKTLKKNGIRAILTAAKGIDLTHSKNQIPFYLQVPGQDRDGFDLTRYFHQSTSFIRDALQSTSIMVHCLAGVSRSVCLVLAYLIKYRGMTYDEAYSLVKSKRSIIHPNDGFITQLKKFETQLRISGMSPIQNKIERMSISPSKRRYDYYYRQKQYESNTKIDINSYPFERSQPMSNTYYHSPNKKSLIDIDTYTPMYETNDKSTSTVSQQHIFNQNYETTSRQLTNSPSKRYYHQSLRQFNQNTYDEPEKITTTTTTPETKMQFFSDLNQNNEKFSYRYVTPERKRWILNNSERGKSIHNAESTQFNKTDYHPQRLYSNYDRLRHTSAAELCQQLDNKIAAIRQKYSQYTKSQVGKPNRPTTTTRQPQHKIYPYHNQNDFNPKKKYPEYQSITSKKSIPDYNTMIKKCMGRSTVGLGILKLNSLRQGYC